VPSHRKLPSLSRAVPGGRASGRRLSRADTLFSAVVLALALLGLAFGNRLIAQPLVRLDKNLSALSPRLFPTLVLAATAAACLIFILSRIFAPAIRSAVGESTKGMRATYKANWRQLVFLLLLLACAVSFEHIGFIACMFVLMTSTSVLAGNRSALEIGILSVVMPVLFYALVTHVLRAPLPEPAFVERLLASGIDKLPGL
jgi:putative tricarboxylic transport membrane protein